MWNTSSSPPMFLCFVLELLIKQVCLRLFCSPLQWCYNPSTVIPGVLFKIWAKHLQSALQVLPHDRAFSCPLHINKQLFVEVEAANMGIAVVTRMRGYLKLEAGTPFQSSAFAQWPYSFEWVHSWVLSWNDSQQLRLNPAMDGLTTLRPFHWNADGCGKSFSGKRLKW